jgi:hypothetical protein
MSKQDPKELDVVCTNVSPNVPSKILSILTSSCRSAVSMTSCVDMSTTGLQRISSEYIYQMPVVDDNIFSRGN